MGSLFVLSVMYTTATAMLMLIEFGSPGIIDPAHMAESGYQVIGLEGEYCKTKLINGFIN